MSGRERARRILGISASARGQSRWPTFNELWDLRAQRRETLPTTILGPVGNEVWAPPAVAQGFPANEGWRPRLDYERAHMNELGAFEFSYWREGNWYLLQNYLGRGELNTPTLLSHPELDRDSVARAALALRRLDYYPAVHPYPEAELFRYVIIIAATDDAIDRLQGEGKLPSFRYIDREWDGMVPDEVYYPIAVQEMDDQLRRGEDR